MSDDDVLESRLHDALRAEADTVVPAGDGLVRIREGIDQARRPAWWRAPAFALAAAAAVAVVLGGGYLLGTRHDAGAPPAAQTTSPTVSTGPSSPEPSAGASTVPAPRTYDGVWVYYVKPEPGQGLKLYRESHDGVTSTGDRSQAALEQVLSQSPADPDYSSVWSGRTLESYVLDSHHATVRLRGGLPASADVGAGVQQIVYTLSAVQSDPSLAVTLYVDGQPVAGTDTKPAVRAPWLDVQGLIWVTAPQQGATVHSPVQLVFYGTAFEGTISWKVLRGGTEVASGFVTGEQGALRELRASVTLPPGSYVVQAFESSAKDGTPIHVDTKDFTVR